MFNVKLVKHFSDYAKFDLANPSLNLVLNQADFTRAGSLSHLAVKISSTEKVLETQNNWVKSGLLTFDAIQVDYCYAKQYKTWIKDPDGNE